MSRPTAPSWILAALLLAGGAGLAEAGRREWKALEDQLGPRLTAVERGEGDEAARKKALDELRTTLQGLLTEDAAQAVPLLLEKVFLSRSRAASRAALAALAGVKDERAVRELVTGFEKAEPRPKVVLAGLLAKVPGEAVTRALVAALRDRDERVQAAAVEALSQRGAEARALAEGPLQRLLRDRSLRLRTLAAGALERVTGQRQPGFAGPPAVGPDGFPDAFEVDRVALLLDHSRAAGEAAFADPFARSAEARAEEGNAEPPAAPAGPAGDKPAKGEEAKPLSPYQIAAAAIRKALERLVSGERAADTTIHLARFGAQVRPFQSGFSRVRAADAAEALRWFQVEPADRDRDVLQAIRRTVEQDPAPQEVYLFLTGAPQGGRSVPGPDETVAAVEDLLWGTGIALHVVAFIAPPATAPTTHQGQLELARSEAAYIAFAEQLAQAGGGRAVQVRLGREAPAGGGGAASAAPAGPALDVDLTKPLARADLDRVEAAFRAALAAGAGAGEQVVEDVAAAADPKAAELALGALDHADLAIARAAARGLARNPDERLRRELLARLQRARQPGEQRLLLQAYAPAPAPEVTKELLGVVDRLHPDAQRLAWAYLAERPAEQLAEHQAVLARLARGLSGQAGFQARVALAKASGTPAPPSSGLTPREDQLLPDRFVAGGVAVIIDTHRDMDEVFWAPPPAPAPAQPAEEPGRGRRGEPDKKDAAPQPQPVTRLQAAVREAERALGALAQGEATAVRLHASERRSAWQAAPMKGGDLEAAKSWLGRLSTRNTRDVGGALEEALGDPAVEVIYLLVSGTPIRGLGDRDPDELIRRIRELERARGVPIHVVYVLGPVSGGAESREAAARQDLLTALDRLYRPLAADSGGEVLIRTRVAGLDAQPAQQGDARR